MAEQHTGTGAGESIIDEANLSESSADFPVVWDDPSHADLEWKRDNVHFFQALPPLAADYACHAIGGGFNSYYRNHDIPVTFLSYNIKGYIYYASRLDVDQSERPAVQEKVRQVDTKLASTLGDYWNTEAMPVLKDTYTWIQELPIESASLAELAALWDEAWARMVKVWGIHFNVVAGSYTSLEDLSDLYESLVENAQASEALTLIQGAEGDLQRVQRDLYLLAEQARSFPEVARRIEMEPNSRDELAEVEGGREFLAYLEAFLEKHGHLGQTVDDLSQPSWREEPSLVMDEIRKRLLNPVEDPEERRKQLSAEASAMVRRVSAQLSERPDDLRRFRDVLAIAQSSGPLSEDHNYWLDRMLHAICHRMSVRYGSRLLAAGVLSDPREIFFLHRGEIRDVLENPADMKAIVSARALDRDRWNSITPPAILGKVREVPPPKSRFNSPDEQEAEQGTLRGVGACVGTVTGPARVVLTVEDFERVQAGDILVCSASNPSWVPLFGIIAGLITNTGGVLAHASVTAREFGIPAVVGTRKATEVIRDGQIVELDGAAGIVRVLS